MALQKQKVAPADYTGPRRVTVVHLSDDDVSSLASAENDPWGGLLGMVAPRNGLQRNHSWPYMAKLELQTWIPADREPELADQLCGQSQRLWGLRYAYKPTVSEPAERNNNEQDFLDNIQWYLTSSDDVREACAPLKMGS